MRASKLAAVLLLACSVIMPLHANEKMTLSESFDLLELMVSRLQSQLSGSTQRTLALERHLQEAQKAHALAAEADAKFERERLAKEKADREERERMAAENKRLREEAAKRDALLAKEQAARRDAERSERKAKALVEKKEREEKEAIAKKEREEADAKQRDEDERLAIEQKSFARTDGEAMQCLLDELEAITEKYEFDSEVYVDVFQGFVLQMQTFYSNVRIAQEQL